MKCCIYQEEKKNKEDQEFINNCIAEFFAQKSDEFNVRQYIMQNSWDEADYKQKFARYKETGELPKKLF